MNNFKRISLGITWTFKDQCHYIMTVFSYVNDKEWYIWKEGDDQACEEQVMLHPRFSNKE